MNLKKTLLIFLMMILPLSSFAQVVSNSEENSEVVEEVDEELYRLMTDNGTLSELKENEWLLKDDESELDIIKSIPEDALALIKAPAGWSKREWLMASGAMTITGLLLAGDEAVRDFAQKHRSELTNDISHYAEMASGRTTVPALAATYLIGTMLKDQKLKKAMVLTFSSLLVSGAIVRTGKFLFGRVRPNRASSKWDFHGPSLDHASFPSGHSQTTFAIAATLAAVYDNKLVGILAYSVATVSSLSRIHDNAHWASDVFVGALIGGLTGHFIAKRHMRATNSGVQLAPSSIYLDNGTQGYGVSLRIPIATGKNKRKKKDLLR